MEGTLFYWGAWIGWTISTFLMPKTIHRFCLSGVILVMIYCSRITLNFDNQSVNAVLIIMVLISYAYIGMHSARLIGYSIFISMIVSFCYLGLHFIIIYDPIWVMLDVTVFIALPISLLILFMTQGLKLRLPILLTGLCHGEIAFVSFFKNLVPEYTLGSFVFLDIIGVGCAIIFSWSMYEIFAGTLKLKVDKPLKHVKEKAQ